MSVWTTFRRLFNKEGISNPDHGYQLAAIEKTSTDSGISVTDERSLKLSSVWACVQLISNSVAGLPLDVFREKDSGREKLKSRHYLTDLLHIRPNAWMKPRDFRLAMTAQMAIWNNAYAEKLMISDRVVGLVPLRPGRMTPHIDDNGELTYHYAVDEGIKVFAKESIFHLKGFGTDGVVGIERNNFARETYGLSVSADTFAAKQFANGGRPGGVLTLDKFLTSEQREQLRELYSGLSEGAINANKLWVLEGGMQYAALDSNAEQMQLIAARSQQISEIARFFGVPEILIGGGTSKNSSWPASFEQQMLMFLTHTIQPYLDEWEAAIKFSLLPRDTDINVDHDPASLVKMDSQAKANFLSTLTQNGLITRNEARVKHLNLPEVEGADELTVQTNLSSLEDLGAINVSQTDQSTRELPTQVQQ